MDSRNMYRLVVWFSFVWYSTHGYPHGGRSVPVNKRSDYSMYDNQFFDVGDTPLDNEVTDCALVRHQYARGYIRLREFLERMEGCGIKGKTKNVAGIAASIKDAGDLPGDSSVLQNTAAKVAQFKPHPIAEVLGNKDQQKPQIAAYHNQGLSQLPLAAQSGAQRSQTFNNFGFYTQENGPLSYSQNPIAIQSPMARKLISRKNMDIPQAQALKNLSGNKNRKWPDPQRYYSEQTAAMAQPYPAPAVTVGQPIVRPNPFPLAFHQQVTSLPSEQQEYQPENPDLNMVKAVDTPDQPVKQVSKAQSGKIRDDINGDQVIDEGIEDEADEATIDHQESDPLPSETSFTYNPNLEVEESAKDSDAIADAQNTVVNTLPNHLNNPLPMNSIPSEEHHDNDYLPNGPTPGKKAASQKQQQKQQDKNTSKPGALPPKSPKKVAAVSSIPAIQNVPAIEEDPIEKTPQDTPNVQASQKVVKPALPETPSGPIQGDDLEGGSETNKLDEFLKPASSSSSDIKPDQNDANDANNQSPDAQEELKQVAPSPTKKPGGLAINLDVLKNRISSSKDVGFLKRMLTLIKKITHHKDFNKLGGTQKSAIMQAGKAVHNAVSKNNVVDQRSSIQTPSANWSPGQYTTQGYVASQQASSAAVQRSFIQQNPPKWNPRDYTNGYSPVYAAPQGVNYAYPSYQASLQNYPPHWNPGDYTSGSPSAQLVKPKPKIVAKKFQIERHPQRPVVSYKPPYASLQRLNFGLYNGNTP